MRKFLFLLFFILLFPVSVQHTKTAAGRIESVPFTAVEPAAIQSLSEYKTILASRGYNLEDQGVLVESLDERRLLAAHNAGIAFNPASVMKLATSLAALSSLGPTHRYRTNFLADGAIDHKSRTLTGDLVVEGGFDPAFSRFDAAEVANRLWELGVGRVTGDLRISGGFYYFATGYHSNLSRETSAAKLREALQRAGIRINGKTIFGEKSGTPLVAHYSDQLTRILLYQNAHSSNAIAEVIGESVGGPEAIQRFLEEKINLRDTEIYVGSTSGLGFNRITPKAALKVLRALLKALSVYSLAAEDIMPVAGIDTGTLKGRLFSDRTRGAIIAKTGTLSEQDNGVSTLVGIAYTRNRGPLLFAIFNTRGNVNLFRRLQDDFLEQLIAESGGSAGMRRTEDALAQETQGSIVQVLHNPATQKSNSEKQ